MKFPRWGRVMLLLLLSSCVYLPRTFGQQNDSDLAPPQTMRMCVNNDCDNLTWTEDHYEAHKDGKTAISARYWITRWEADHVEFTGKTATAVDGVYPLEATFTGKIAPGGNSIAGGSLDWRVGYSASGSGTYTLTWKAGPSNATTVGNVGQFQAPRHSKANPNILLPPGASEVYVSYPDVVRALLQPDYALTPKDARRACHDPYVLDVNTALEIARFAYRAGDMKRGDCWLITSGELGNTRAKVIYATTFLYGWQGTTKDEAKGFGMLKMFMSTKDPFDIWLLLQCYIDGTGTPKDAHQAAILTSYALTHNDVERVSLMIGSDDAEKVLEYQRLMALMFPPETTSTTCSIEKAPDAPGGRQRICHTSSEVDQKALQRNLDNVDREYSEKVKQKP